MRQLNNIQSKNNNLIIVISAAITTFFMAYPASAELKHAKKALDDLKKILLTTLSLLLLPLYCCA